MNIFFDMDGTISNLYGVDNWLDMLINNDPTPYSIAKPLVNLSRLARALNRLQLVGHKVCVITWLSKASTPEYDALVTSAKMVWLHKHLPSVVWDEIKIVPYGTNKWDLCKGGILFDDEEQNRKDWKNGAAFHPDHIFDILNLIIEESDA